jgi:acyl-homoserine-lactone acylase
MRSPQGLLLVFLALAAAAVSCVRPAPLTPQALSDRVVIRRDRFGVPHITADSHEAAALAFGYAQAEDHFAVIARRLIAARGEEAKHFGAEGIENDLAMARLDNLAESRRGLDLVGPVFRRMLAAYASGVNLYARQRGGDILREFDAADVMASLRASAVESVGGSALVRQLREKYERRTTDPPPERAIGTDEAPGSNALALHGSRTAGGKPILLGNPHLNWSSRYWEAHVTVPGRMNFYGSTLAGLPVLRAGFNDRLGFVQTNNAPDLDDVYRLTLDPAAPDHYIFDGRSYALTRRDVAIDVRTDSGELRKETRTYWSSHLGPIVHRDSSAAFALASVRLDAWRYFEGFHHAAQARTLDEFLAVMRERYVPTSNFTYADVDGNILYLWNARLPRRLDDGSSYALDVPGEPKYLWRGFHELDELPRLLNPPGGYVQNANNPPRFPALGGLLDMTRYPSYVERGELGLRPQLAVRMLEDRRRFSADDVMGLKFDTRVLLASRVKPALIEALRAAAELSAEAKAGLATLEGWDDRASAASRGAALFFRFWDTYSRDTRAPFATRWDEHHPVDTPSGLSDPAAAVAHLEEAVRWTRQTFGREDVAWGEINRYRIGEIDLPAEGCTGTYGCFRVQRFMPAGEGRVNVAGNLKDRGLVGFGDAWVLLVDFSTPLPTARSVLAYGQTADLDSPHSRDQIGLFAERRLRPVWFAEADVRANVEREYHPGTRAVQRRAGVGPREH